MAKSKKKDKKDGVQSDTADAIRAAIERGLQVSAEGAQATQKRTRELVDEIAAAAGRVRQSLEDMKVLDELRKLRTEVEALAGRVAALERPRAASTSATTTTSASSRPAAAKSRAKTSSTRARKPAARKSAAKKSTTSTRSRAKKSTGTTAAAKKSTGSS